MNGRIVDPSQPTQAEIAQIRMRIMKGTLACDLAKALAGTETGAAMTSDALANTAIGVAEAVIDKFTLMGDFTGGQPS